MTTRTGVFVGYPDAPVMQYERENTPSGLRIIHGDVKIVHIGLLPENGLKGVVDFERRERGIGQLEQFILRRIRIRLETGEKE